MPRAKKRIYWALAMCLLGAVFYFYEYYLRVAPSVITAELIACYNISIAQFGHLIACYSYAYVLMQLPVGVMMDRFGPRRILTMACVCCAVGTYVFASNGNFIIGQLSRFLIGFGSAFAYVGVLKLASIWLPKHYFPTVAGICSSLGVLGGFSGTVIMTGLVASFGWVDTLYYAAVLGLFLAILLWIWLKDSKRTQNNQPNTTLLCGLKTIVKNKTLWINGLIGFFSYVPMSMFADLWAIPYLKTLGQSRTAAAWGASLLYIGFGIGGPIWGIVSVKLKSRRIPLMLGTSVAAILASIILITPEVSTLWVQVLLFLLGFFASVEILVFAVSNDLVNKSLSATALSFTNMIIMLSAALLIPFVGKLIDLLGEAHFNIALAIMPLLLFAAALLSFVLRETYH